MHPALIKLLRLRARALVRKIVLGLRSPRRAALTLITLAFVVAQTSMMLIGTFAGGDVFSVNLDIVGTWLPVGLMLFFLVQILSPNSQAVLAFTPPEMQFLFPAPFPRHHLILYKIVGGISVLTLLSLFMSLVALRFGAMWVSAFSGLLLYMTMGFLTSIVLSLALKDIAARFRWWTVGTLLAFFLIVGAVSARFYFDDIASDPLAAAERIRESVFYIVLLAPFRVFAAMVLADSLSVHFILNLALGITMCLAALLSIFKLDANFIELSMTQSQLRQKRLERSRRGKILGRARARSANLTVPALPRWGGVGPIVRRQTLAVVRGPVAWKIFVLAGLAGVVLGYIMRHGDNDIMEMAKWAPLAVVAYAMLFLSALIRYDFRSEVECLDKLKTLPISPLPISVGELLVPVTVVTMTQVLFCAAFAIGNVSAPLNPLFIFVLFSVNGLVYTVENAFFLVFPTRNTMVTMADTAEFGRRILVFMLKMAVLLLVGGLAGGSGALVYFLTNNLGGAVFTGWAVLTLCLAAFVALVAQAFKQLDPSIDFG